MKKYIFLIVLLSLLLIGCGESVKTSPEEEFYESPKVLLNVNYVAPPSCGEYSQVKPTNLAPQGIISDINPNPTFTWDFEGCDVYTFDFNLDTNPRVTGYWWPQIMETVDGMERSFTPTDADLEPCVTYYYKVNGNGAEIYRSDITSFMIDDGTCPQIETCTYGTSFPYLVRPYFVSSNPQKSGPNPQLVWGIDDYCKADNFHYEVSQVYDFSQIIIEGDTPETMVSPSEPYLEDCSDYLWRVTSEANGYSRTSEIGSIQTDFGLGNCEKPLCSADQLIAPELIQPLDHSVITMMNIFFLWKNNGSCQPESYIIEIDSDPGFEDPIIVSNKNAHPSYLLSEPTWIDWSFSNCQPYYWRVTAFSEDGQTSVISDTRVFLYNAGDAICPFWDYQGIEPVELVNNFSLGCVSSSQMWALYDFKGPVCGNFEVHIGNRTWPCELVKGSINQLMCFGALASQQTELPVQLFLVGGLEPVLVQDGTTPQCSGAVGNCQQPAEGCVPIKTVDVFGGPPIYTPTHWDAVQCACVP